MNPLVYLCAIAGLLCGGCALTTAASSGVAAADKDGKEGDGAILESADVDDIRLALAAHDWRAVIRIAHQLGEARARAQAEEAIDSATRADLENAWASLRPLNAFPRGLVGIRLGRIYLHLSDVTRARQVLGNVRGEQSKQARRVLDEIESPPAAVIGKIAVLLPLSGPFAAIGKGLRPAIELGLVRGGAPIDVDFFDTKGEPPSASAAVDAAVAGGAEFILGPVGERETIAAARRAVVRKRRIAVLTPSIDGGSSRLYRLASSSAAQARAAAKFTNLLGFRTVAIFAPRDGGGRRSAEAFARVATGLGIRIVARGDYDPTLRSLESDLRSFLSLDPATNKRLRQHYRRYGKDSWKTYSPDLGFELVFIPDGHRHAALIASYFRYFNVELRTREVMSSASLRRKHGGRLPSVVQLLGLSSWQHPGLIAAGGRAVEGALIVACFAGGESTESAYAESDEFRREYEMRVGYSPSTLAAEAHDAALLVASAAQERVATGRTWTQALRSRRVSGACGPARIGATGDIERENLVLRVENGSFVIHDY